MSAIPELLRIVGKRHELDVENEKLKAEVERLGDRINRINNDNFNLANALSKAHEELCQAGLREYGN